MSNNKITIIDHRKEWQIKEIEEQKQDLKNLKTIYVVGLKQSTNRYWDAGHWKYFRLYYMKNGELRQVWFYNDLKDLPSAWNKKHLCFDSSVLGSDRTFEIVYSLYMFYFYEEDKEILKHMPKIEFLSWFD